MSTRVEGVLIGVSRTAIGPRLRGREGELRREISARIANITSGPIDPGPDYLDSLTATVATATDYAISAIESGEEHAPAVPVAMLAQARLAARNMVPLETVIRRYIVGYNLLADLVVEEASRAPACDPSDLQCLLRSHAAILDRVIGTLSEEYRREANRPVTAEERRANRVRQLLGGELLEARDLDYDFDLHHVALVVTGRASIGLGHFLSDKLGTRQLTVRPDPDAAWVWISHREEISVARVVACLERRPYEDTFAIGESGLGIRGFRSSHRQACAAHRISVRTAEIVTVYADIALEAALMSDELLCGSLRRRYLEPLGDIDGNGEVARSTIRAYIAAGHNISSAAAELGLSRQTVSARMRVIEERIGIPLSRCSSELDIALRLEGLEQGRVEAAAR